MSIVSQPWLFQRLRWLKIRNAGAFLAGPARVRIISIAFCSLLVAGTVFAGAFEGFLFLQKQQIPFGGRLIGLLFDFLFLSLAVLLVFSGGIILYSSLFTAPETAFLLGTPARADQVFAYKFQSAIAFSSWAFVLLGLPILIAYGLVLGSSWLYYALLPIFLIGFLLIPGSIGALVCLLIVNVAPQKRNQVLVLLAVLVTGAAAAWAYRTAVEASSRARGQGDTLHWLDGQFAFMRGQMVPSHWMTRGVQAAARGNLQSAAYPLALLWSNGLMLYLMAALAAQRWYRRGYNRLQTGGSLRKKYGGAWIDRTVARLLGFLDPQTRLLIVKDLRTFRRDPAQWAQVLIFAGLMLLYFINAPQFYQSDRGKAYQHIIGFTNVLATGMLMCAYMSRFVYPMLSLEGRKFWILGLLPLRRERLLWGKFAFAASGALIVGCGLVTASDLMLGLPGALLVHIPAVVALALGLSGLSVGLGAIVPNFRETDPSKIAVGAGGTLNLIAGLLYLLLVIALMTGPYHLVTALREGPMLSRWIGWIVVGCTLGGALAVTATFVPLRIGVRMLNRMEF
jgi:ABC-2 type transport system permease protein